MQQEGRRSRSALGVFGSSCAGALSLSAAPARGQETERTTTVPGYAGASDVEKLRSASVWHQDNNPYYHNVEWREGWAEECLKNDVDIGQTREEDRSVLSILCTPIFSTAWQLPSSRAAGYRRRACVDV